MCNSYHLAHINMSNAAASTKGKIMLTPIRVFSMLGLTQFGKLYIVLVNSYNCYLSTSYKVIK